MINSLVRYVFFIVLGVALSAGAAAQLAPNRLLPAKGKRAELGAALPLPMLQVGGAVLRLAPGGVIYDESNRAILHTALPPHANVWYTTDANGDVQRMYVLTAAEQALLDAKGQR